MSERSTPARQVRWQRKMVQSGRCRSCGTKRNHYAQLCDECQKKVREWKQRRLNCKPWTPGGPGKEPFT